MTTPPVVSITDELIAELEAAANACESWYVEQDLGITLDLVSDEDNRFVLAASPATILALLAHIADLKRQLAAASVDADRYRWIRDKHNDERGNCWVSVWDKEVSSWVSLDRAYVAGFMVFEQPLDLDAAIDAARNIGSGD